MPFFIHSIRRISVYVLACSWRRILCSWNNAISYFLSGFFFAQCVFFSLFYGHFFLQTIFHRLAESIAVYFCSFLLLLLLVGKVFHCKFFFSIDFYPFTIIINRNVIMENFIRNTTPPPLSNSSSSSKRPHIYICNHISILINSMTLDIFFSLFYLLLVIFWFRTY